ncbi:unnamed protein product [Cunninghamella blakesleeana]
MDELLQFAHNWPVEDLTSEVQDLLLRESMSWLPWVDTTNDATLTNNKNNDPLEGLDPQLLAQSLQLDSLFGQEINFDQLDEVAQSSLLYDELTYEPSTDNSPLSTPSVVQEEVFEEVLPENEDDNTDVLLPAHHQKDLSKNDNVNDLSGDSSSSDEEEEKDNKDMQVNVTNNEEEDDDDDSTDDDSTDDDSDDEDEEENGVVDVRTTSYMYLPKRQIEEALLEKITHRLHADKLPGILSIVSASNDNEQREEEVEIDLSSLGREQLVRVMLYVDACIEEQQGGPSVKLSNYIVKDPKAATSSSVINKKHEEEKDTFTEIDNHELNAGQKRKRNSKPSPSTPIDGPISMAGLTKRTRVNGNKKKALNHPPSVSSNTNSNNPSATSVSKRRRKTASSSRRKQQDSSASMKVKQNGMSSTRPKRRAALHKRRMLEETLLTPSDDDNDDDISITPVSTPVAAVDHEVLIVYSDEQMDFGVVENQTIVHQPSTSNNNSNSFVSQTIQQSIAEDDEDDEEIDIM